MEKKVNRKFKKAEEANKHALKLASEIGEKLQQCYSHYDLAYTYLKSGEPVRAIEEIKKAWNLSVEEEDLDMQRKSLFSKGLIYLEMGLFDKALETAKELKTVIDSGMNKKEIINIARQIGTYDISKQPYGDCCTYFLPKHPVLKADIKVLEEVESNFDVDALIKEAIKDAEVKKF